MEFIEYFEIDPETLLIDTSMCEAWTPEKRKGLSEFYVEELVKHCTEYNRQDREALDYSFKVFMWCLGAAILVFFFIGCCYLVGFGYIAKQVFYLITFRFCLKAIIKIRNLKEE